MCFPLHMAQLMGDCGTLKDTLIHTMLNGNEVRRGAWPFVAALYEKPKKFICGATVLSTRHVLTAAHCIQDKYTSRKYGSKDISVRLGAHNVTAEIEEGAQNANVSEIHVHKDWDPYTNRYDADIAILVLSIDVDFTNLIQPICLPTDDVISDDAVDHIVGWGNGKNEKSQEIPRESVSRALNNTHCYLNQYSLAQTSSPRLFCAGDGRGGVPNSGDSGGGFFVVSQTHWVQLGIISAVQANATGHVTTESVAIFLNVKLFRTWIEATMELTSEWRICECWLRKYEYTCRLVALPMENFPFDCSGILHQQGQTNDDLPAVIIHDFKLLLIGSKIGKVFRNLKKLHVNLNTNMKHNLSSTNFENMENLTELNIVSSSEENLEGSFSTNFPNLEKVSIFLFPNARVLVDEKTFQSNSKLKEVDLSLVSIPWNLFRKNVLLKRLKIYTTSTILDARTFETNVKLSDIYIQSDDIYIQSDNVKSIPWNLLKNNLMLEKVTLHFRITEIDERAFETNEILRYVDLSYNQLEFLPRDLFKNDLILEEIHFRENRSKIIEIDVSSLENVKLIDLASNSCVNSIYRDYKNLTELQSEINSSCISRSTSRI